MAKKKRTKTKKQSPSTASQVEETERKQDAEETVEEVEASDDNNSEKAETSDDSEKAETKANAASEETKAASEEKAKASDDNTETKASDDSGFSAKAARTQLDEAEKWLAAGNNQEARGLLVEVVERGAPLEERERALALLQQIELDVRTLLVGAVAMLALVLIPTVGLVNALWALPLLLPILLPIVPGVVGLLSFWAIPFLVPLSTTWHMKFFVPVAGFLLALVLLIVQRSPSSTPSSS